MLNNEDQNPEKEKSPFPFAKENQQDTSPENLKADEKAYQQTREAQYEQILPGKYGELQQDLENDGFLSDEEILAVMDEQATELGQAATDQQEEKQRQQLEEQQAQLSELKESTGLPLNTDDVNFMIPDLTLTNLVLETPATKKPEVTKLDLEELNKVDIQPSFLFAKDENGEIKVASQHAQSNDYRLNKPEERGSFTDYTPAVFLTKGMLENFIENFTRTHSLMTGTIKYAGEKISKLVNGKLDLILVPSKPGYADSLNMAKEFFSENNNLKPTSVNQNQPTKYDESQVNWGSLEKIGISKERLQATGQINKFLNGEKTSLIEPSSLKEGNKYPFGNTPFKLYLEPGANGVENKLIFKEPRLKVQDEYEGQKLSVDDKLNLITKGHLGRLMDINGKPHFVSVDRDLNAIGHREADTLKVPAKIKLANGSEIQLNKDQQELLSQGKPVPVADLKDNKGQAYSGQLIVNASSGKLDVMREIPSTMAQTVAQNEDKKQVQVNNEGVVKQRIPEKNNPKLGL